MKAMLVNDEQMLVLSEVENPKPKYGEILIEIHAAALNRADILQRKGTYPSPTGWPEWMGLEVSGIIHEIGIGVPQEKFKIGDRVCALLGGGGYAEFVAVPYGMVMPMPKNLTFEEAASIPEAYATSYLNLFYEGHLKPGQTVFIPAGASGLASVAIPLAKAFGARVITSVLTDEKAKSIEPLGADIIINSSTTDVADVFKEQAESGYPISVVMDCLSGETIGRCLPYMAEGGYWIVISTLAGTETTIPLRALLTKGLHIVGSMLRKRSSEEKANLLRELVERVWPKIENGTITPSIYKILPFEMANEAHAILERGENVGKVVLKIK